ncbi:MAG: PilZ domain-containing protein [Salaquimonas sp.]|jgi:hypothetical protein|nr:PilZ domain-containing protein [Salaquimonas sp.]
MSISQDDGSDTGHRSREADQRQTARQRRGQRLGYLVVNGQSFPVPCTVRDFGSGSATLLLGGWLGIPDQFSLYVEPDEVRLECRIAERRGNSVTVSFDGLVSEARPRIR